ncbi:MAG: sigma-70 family RNA polymerase sigma factor [Clostridiales bacterium]|nr:sigma-70 family RNA polymerase sigma factor [Clostridiales bacterium]
MTDKELEKIYNEAYKAVYWTAMSLLKNEADAEDIVQETFVTLIESFDSIKDKTKVMPWLKKTAANKCLDRIKLAKTDAVEDEFFEDVEAVPEDFLPDSIIESAEMRKIIMDIIEKSLSDDIRRTLILFYFDEMSTKEIAETLGVPEGTVRRRLNFARNKIKKEVEKYEEDNKTKLFGMAALPFLSKLFIKEAEQVPFKAMSASLTTTLSASAQASTQGAGTKIAASAAKKGTGIIMKKAIIGSIAAIVAVGVVVGIIIGVLSKKADTEPKKTTVNEEVDEPQGNPENIVEPNENDETDPTTGAGINGTLTIDKITTKYGEFYFKDTIGEFIDELSANGELRFVIQDDKNNKYTLDDLDTSVTAYVVGVIVYHDDERLFSFEADRVEDTKIRDCEIDGVITETETTSIEISGNVIEINKSTVDDIVGMFGDYQQDDIMKSTYSFLPNGYNSTSFSVTCNDDNTVDYVFVHILRK